MLKEKTSGLETDEPQALDSRQMQRPQAIGKRSPESDTHFQRLEIHVQGVSHQHGVGRKQRFQLSLDVFQFCRYRVKNLLCDS